MEQDGDFFPRLPSKRVSALSGAVDAPSFRLYHGVPFVWESKPGEAKTDGGGGDTSSAIPPLTPPPSYYCAENKHSNKSKKISSSSRSRKKNYTSRFKLMVEVVLRAFTVRKVRYSPAMPSLQVSSLSSTSSSSLFSRLGSSRSSVSSSVSFRRDDDDSVGRGPTRSGIICFRVRRVPCMSSFYCGRG